MMATMVADGENLEKINKQINNNKNNINNNNSSNNNNNNNNIPVALKYLDEIRQGIVKSYGQMKRSLALVGSHLEMVSR